MGYILQNYGIYWSIGYIKQKLRDVLGNFMGYTGKKLWDILWDIFVQSFGIYLAKTKGYIGFNYGIYYGIYWLNSVGYIWQNYGMY